MFIKTATTIISLTMISQAAFADHPTLSLGEGGASPLTTISANPIERGHYAIGFRVQSIFNDELPDSVLESLEGIHSVASVYSASLGGAFGATDNLTLGVQLPYVARRDIREAHHDEHGTGTEPAGHEDPDQPGEMVMNMGDSRGIGDTTLYGQYRFWGTEDKAWNSALLFGLKAPTGVTDERSIEGERFETEHQPGSGSWDALAGLALTRSAGKFQLDANVLYTLAGEGSQDTNLGDVCNYNLALSIRMHGSEAEEHSHAHAHGSEHGYIETVWDIIFELNGDWREKVRKPEGRDDNTGGNIVYLSAGTRANWAKGWSGYLSVGFPIIKRFNGVQSEPESRWVLGVSKGF